MDLGCGFYLIISTRNVMPYEPSKLENLLRSLESEIELSKGITYFNIKANLINYDIVMEGLETFNRDSLIYDDLSNYPLSSIDILFTNGLIGRISIMFFDDSSYEVSFITNYSEVFEESSNNELKTEYAEKVEQIALIMFKCLQPIYGVIGVEQSCEALADIKSNKSLLPIDKVYLSYKIYDSNIQTIVAELNFSVNLKNGIYLRNSALDDFSYNPDYDIRDRIIGDNTHFWGNNELS